jgi:hypothetical protein
MAADISDSSNWIRDYLPLAAALAAVIIAAFNYLTSRPKLKLEMEKLQKEIENLSENTRTNSDSISEMQKNVLPGSIYSDEVVVYNNSSGNLGFDFVGTENYRYEGDERIPGKAAGEVKYLDKGIINIERSNSEGRYELYLRSYTLGARKSEFIPKDTVEDEPRRLRISCEARTLNGEHTLRFVMRDREAKKWIGKSYVHRISSPEWRRIEGYFTVRALVEAELRIDDEDISIFPSTIQIRNLIVAQRKG